MHKMQSFVFLALKSLSMMQEACLPQLYSKSDKILLVHPKYERIYIFPILR